MRLPLVCLPILLLLPVPLSAQASSLGMLKAQVRASLAPTLDWGNPDEPFTAQSLDALESSADFALSELQPDGFFSDIDTSTINVWARDVQSHATRLLTLARAYHTAGQSHFQNPATLAGFRDATGALEDLLYDGMPKPGNWWNWEIGLPLQYGPALFLMQDEVEPSMLEEAIATLRYMIKEAPSPWSQTGQNLIWVSFTRLYLGLLTDDTSLLDWAREQIASTCVITTGEGIQPDHSFHQHGPSLQTGAYGAGLAQDIGVYAYYARDTDWALTGEQLQIWLDYLTHGSRWAIYRNYYEPSTRGREIVRQDTLGSDSALRALLYGASLEAGPDRPLAQSALHTLETWTKPLQPGDVAIASEVLALATEPSGPVGVKMYPTSDYIVQRGGDWLLSVKMLSDRTLAAERYNDEGKQSRHLSSGVHWLVMEGDEWDTGGVRPSLDWARLPGATTEIGLDLSKAYPNGSCYGLRSFVGGMAEDGFGVAAMDWQSREENGDSDLVAQKSWFFWPGGMVALGSGITGRNSLPVATTAMQWPMSSSEKAVVLNQTAVTAAEWEQSLSSPLWVNADSVSYHVPAGQQVRVSRGPQSGRFIDITREGTDVQTNDFLTIGFDHGTNPAGAAYAYAILPRHAQTQGNPPYSIVRHDGIAHAARFTESGTLSIAFWQPGVAGPFIAASPVLVMDQNQGPGTHRLHVVDPTQADTTIELLVAGTLTLSGEPTGVVATPVGTPGMPLHHLQIDVSEGLPTSLDFDSYEPLDLADLPPVAYDVETRKTDTGTVLHVKFTRPVDRGLIMAPGCLEIFPYVEILAIDVPEDGLSANLTVAGLIPDVPYHLIVNGLPADGEEAHGEKHWLAFRADLPEIANSIEAAADTFVRDGQYAADNFGMSNILSVKQDGTGYWRDAFLKFDLTQLKAPVGSAFLSLHVQSSGGLSDMEHRIYATDTGWDETALTWNTAPATGNLLASFAAPLPGESVLVDLTPFINSSLGQVVSLRIVAADNYGSEGWLNYASSENTDSAQRPQLLLDTAGTPFGQWINALVPEALAGEGDDPDGDGLANLLEFALGLDPSGPDYAPFPWVDAEPGGNPGLIIPAGYPTGRDLRVEATPDLLNWSPKTVPETINHEGKTGYLYRFMDTTGEFIRIRLDIQ